jgi:hypothetical protein
MANPRSFLEHLREKGYHPRSDKHSNALAQAIVRDLVAHCPAIATKAANGALVYQLNVTLMAGTSEWNVDLALGPPELEAAVPPGDGSIIRASPSIVEIGIELKAVMTEHRKAVKNRKRDLEAHHEHVHNYKQNAVAGGVLILNAASQFKSPLRLAPTLHRNPDALVEHCLNELRAVAGRGGSRGYGLDGKCGIVLRMDNIDLQSTEYVVTAPAPVVGDPLHYDSFIRTICDNYSQRFGQ